MRSDVIFAIHGGNGLNKKNGEFVKLSFRKLCWLYGIKKKYCVFISGDFTSSKFENLIHLYPLKEWNYKTVLSDEIKRYITENDDIPLEKFLYLMSKVKKGI